MLMMLNDDRPVHHVFSRSLKDSVKRWKMVQPYRTSALDSSSLPKRTVVIRTSRKFPNVTRNWNDLSTAIPPVLLMRQKGALEYGRHDHRRTGLVDYPRMHIKA
jgi:hypothetical protein